MSQVASPSELAQRLRSVHVGVRAELDASRHIMHGQPAYVIRDPVTFQSHRLSSDDYQVFVALTETDELGATFSRLCATGRLAEDQEEEFYRFVLRLAQMGLLSLPVSDGGALYTRFQRRRAARRKATITGFLFLRVPLIRPDAFLNRTVKWVQPLFTRTAALLWSLGVVVCSLLVLANWTEFASPIKSMLAIGNLPVLWVLLVGLKVVHEFGHAYACRHFGGYVPEMGAFFIVFTPCAYVDASASWGFPSRLHRIIVALAGMYFESFMAMLAIVVWALTEPGTLHSAAQYAVVLSTAITIGFNANPLMKYDGYFVLCDLLGMPNLRSDSQQQVTAVLKKLFFRIETSGAKWSRSTRLFLTSFGLASSVYKVVVVLGISIMIAFKVPVAGMSLAAFYVGSTLWQAGTGLVRYLRNSEEIAHIRARAVCLTAAGATALGLLITCVPVPAAIDALGIVARRDDQVIRAGAAGFLAEVFADEGSRLPSEAKLCQLRNIELTSAVQRQRAELTRLNVELQRELVRDLHAAAEVEQRILQARQELARLNDDAQQLNVLVPIEGEVVEAEALRHLGSYVEKGQPLATVSSGPWCIEALVPASLWAEAEPRIGDRVEGKLVGASREIFSGRIAHLAQAGSRLIEEPALTQLGGGDITITPSTMEAEEPFFRVTIELADAQESSIGHGMTAVVHLSRANSTMAQYFYRRTLNLWNSLRTLN